MDQPDFRALTQELFDQLSAYDGCDDGEEVSQHRNYTNCNELLYRTRTALATSPPEPPTDDELMALAVTVFEDPFATDKDYGRAALERWGR